MEMEDRSLGWVRRWRDPRRVERWLARAGGLALALAAALALSGGLREQAARWLQDAGGPAGAEHVRVVEVVDGDTLVVEDGRSVRVLGVDAPETHNPNLEGPQPLGAAATARLAALVAGRTVGLERDTTDADHYGRALRHVWVGRTLVAERLVAEGLGRVLVIPPDTRHADRLRAAEADAKADRRGVWGLPRPTALPIFAASDPAAGPAPAATAGGGAPAATLAVPAAGTAVTATLQPAGGPSTCAARVPGAVSAAEALDLVDTYQAVAFEVVRTKDTGRVTFLNSHDPYQGHFYVAIFPSDYDKYPAPPAIYFRGKCIVVQGTIERYRGTPQMVLRGPEDVRVVGDAAAPHGAPEDEGG